MADRYSTHVPLGGFRLTDRALVAIGVVPSRPVPLIDLPWRDEARDRSPDHEEVTGERS